MDTEDLGGEGDLVPVRAERFAASGLLLKVLTMGDVVKHGDRANPGRMTMEDKARTGTKSVLRLANMQFDVELPADQFSRRRLERGD